MKTLFRDTLSKEIIKKSNEVKNRIWISSPYIGGEKSVLGILGYKFRSIEDIDLRLLVDISDINNCIYQTLNSLIGFGFQIKTLLGLHAKIYIFDDECVITSANLTGRAFTMKNEIGIALDKTESKSAIQIFEYYYKHGKVIDKFSDSEISKQKMKRGNKNDGNEPGEDTKRFFTIPEPELPKYTLSRSHVANYLQNFRLDNTIWKISLGRRWVEENIYDSCLRTNTIAIGWFDDRNISNWDYQRILHELNSDRINDHNRTQNANSINYFIHGINIGDLVLVYSDRTKIRAIGIVVGNYEWRRNLIGQYAHRRNVIWLTQGGSIDIYRINGNKELSEMTLYGLWDIDHDEIRKLILSQ